MEYKKTTILPTDDPELARTMFNELVHDFPYILMVVLGVGKDAEKFVERASKLSGIEDEPRWVLWCRKPDQIADNIAELNGGAGIAKKLNAVRGFCTSLSDEVRDIVKMSEGVPKFDRLVEAYAKAEAKKTP